MVCIVRHLVLASILCLPAVAAAGQPQEPPPRILLDVSPRAIEYQLDRLSNADLIGLDRDVNDPRHRPIFVAILTRRGLGREYFDEALAALARIDHASPAAVLLDALPRVRPDDEGAAERVLRVLLAQPVEALREQRARLERAVDANGSPWMLQAAYGGLILADGSPTEAWDLATSREGHLRALLRSVHYLPDDPALKRQLGESIADLLAEPIDDGTRAAVVEALAWARPDASTFAVLVAEVEGDDPAVRAAAVRSLGRMPAEARTPEETDRAVRAIVQQIGATSLKQRTEPALLEAMQVADRLSEALDPQARRAVRRELRALGVQVVRIEAVPEQMLFDRRWFVVEAGKPVQILFVNPDAMAHNLLVVTPGSLQEVGIAASTMPLPTDPSIKPYVPETPQVLHATRLLNWGETERLSFMAPRTPGEYPYVCTFPGHWVRMYGVMLVVEDLEAWEANRAVPRDPMTGEPMGN